MNTPITARSWKIKIIERKIIARDTTEITFRQIDKGFSFREGQYVWIVLQHLQYTDPKGNWRAFSLCTSPVQSGTFSIVFRNSESGFKKTLLSLPINAEVQAIGPFGNLDFPEDTSRPVVILTGGVGIAPFMSMIRTAAAKKDPRTIMLLYANTDPDHAVYSDELTALSAQHSMITVKQKTGHIDWSFISHTVPDTSRVVWYVTGPENMVRSTAKILYDHKVEEKNIRFDEFYVSPDSFDHKKDKLWETVEIFKLAVESSFNHIILTDINGTIVFSNKGAEIITGFTKDEMLHQTPRLWGGHMSKEFYEKLWHTIKIEKKPFECDFQNRRKNGTLYNSIARISPIFDNTNSLVGFMGTEEDITPRLMLEEELHKKIADLEKINKFMIGRELRMRDLKKRITTLESQLKNK